jgi:hypothetical protein
MPTIVALNAASCRRSRSHSGASACSVLIPMTYTPPTTSFVILRRERALASEPRRMHD